MGRSPVEKTWLHCAALGLTPCLLWALYFLSGIVYADWRMGQKSSRPAAGCSEAHTRCSSTGGTRGRACYRRSVTVSRQRPHAGSLWLLREREYRLQSNAGPGECLVAHEESKPGGGIGHPGLGGMAARGRRCSGPWPQCGHWVPSVPVHCHIHSATGFSWRLGGAGWCSSGRHWRRVCALQRFARTPRWRIR